MIDMDTASAEDIHSIDQPNPDDKRKCAKENRRSVDSNEEERLMLTTTASINSLDTRAGETEDGSSLKHMADEDLKTRRRTVMNAFRIGSADGSSRPSTGASGYRGKTPVPFVIEQIVTKRGNQLYQRACETLEKDDYVSTISYLTKAIVLDPDNCDYFMLRGETYLLMSDFQSAINNYRWACIIQPENERLFRRLAFIYYLQGQTFFDEKNYNDALEYFSKAVEIQPDSLGFHMRSIACLAVLQRHGECLALVNKRIDIETDNADLYVMRARIHDTFRNDSLCYFDVVDALRLDPESSEAKKMLDEIQKRAELYKSQAMKFDLVGKRYDAIAKITSAIEVEPTVPDLHVYRSSLLRRNRDFVSAVDDLLLAMDKTRHDETHPVYKQAQKQLLLTYNDFAVDCFKKGFYEEAITLLDKAIKREKREKILYKNRGDCFYRTKELHFALSDYLQALDLDDLDESVKCKLANVYNDLGVMEYSEGRYQQAEEFLSVAISYNPRISSFYASRARSRYMLENQENSKVDVISALCIDNNNKEVMSLFTSLFPGKTITELLDSQLGKMVGLALASVIGEVTGEPQDSRRAFSGKNVLPNIRQPNIPIDVDSNDESLHSCMDHEDIKIRVIKEKRKVNELIASVVHSRQSLEYTGPRVKEQNLLALGMPSWLEKAKEPNSTSRKAITRDKQTDNAKEDNSCAKPKQITFLKA